MFALAVTAPLAVTAVLIPFRASFTNAGAALILVAVVVAVSVAGSRVSGVVASASSALWFDVFLTRPYEKLAISHRPDVESTICLLAVGLVVSELAARSRHHFRVSSEESRYVAMVRELMDLAQDTTGDRLIERTKPMLRDLLDLRDCRFDVRPSSPPMARILASGDVVHVGLRWPVEESGIPGPQAEILTQWRGRMLGRFVITPTPGVPVSQERRAVAALLATVVAAAVANDEQSV
jgi:hypothetical protein